MKPFFRHFSDSLGRLRAVRSLLVVFLGLVLAASGYAAFSSYYNSRISNSATAGSQGTATREDLEAELITVLPTGFEPAEIVRPAGPFVLALDNQSGLRELVFRLDRESAPRVDEVRLGRKTEFTRILDLPAGVYQVTEANHPDWIMTLKLTTTR